MVYSNYNKNLYILLIIFSVICLSSNANNTQNCYCTSSTKEKTKTHKNDKNNKYSAIEECIILPTEPWAEKYSNNNYIIEIYYYNKYINLGFIGNNIRKRAGSNFSKKMFENYWTNGGNINLSISTFYNIINTANKEGVSYKIRFKIS